MDIFSTILDVTILLLLIASVVYSYRLSSSIKIFSESRKELTGTLEKMAFSIVDAEKAIERLRMTANESGKELQDTVNQARSLSEELQFINEAGDNLARRLEKLAEQGGKASKKSEKIVAPHVEDSPRFSDPDLEQIFLGHGRNKKETKQPDKKPKTKEQVATASSPFAIRDPDFDRGDDSSKVAYDEFSDEEMVGDGENLHTQAERDLYAALMQKRMKRG